MMSIGAGSKKYFKKEFDAAQERYLEGGDRLAKGGLADAFGLEGEVSRQHYERLCDGKHPITGRRIIRAVRGETYLKDGETARRVEHRAGWDATFSAPKSVSEAALVGGDRRLVEAHRKAVAVALGEMEKFAQARMGATAAPKTTGNLCIIQFEHDSARPVEGFAAPQLHTHNFVMNMTKDGPGKYRALHTRAIYEAQHYLTTVYRATLAEEVRALGYEIVPTKNGAFELKGYDSGYLAAISPRAGQRDEALKARGLEYSPAAAQAAVLETRQPKLETTEAVVRGMWEDRAEAFGAARPRGNLIVAATSERDRSGLTEQAVTHGLERALDRTGEADETAVLAEALKYRIGEVRLTEAKRNLAGRIGLGEVIEVTPERAAIPRAVVTTPEFARLRRETERMAKMETAVVKGQLSSVGLDTETVGMAVAAARCGRRVIEIDGAKGTSVVAARAVAEGLQGSGYAMAVIADKSRAKFEEWSAPILMKDTTSRRDRPTVYVVADEAVTSLREFHGFLSRLEPDDRVILAGDVRRRLATGENGLIGKLREAGMPVFPISGEVRERNAVALEATLKVTEGKTREGLQVLAESGRVTREVTPERRAEAVARLFGPDAIAVTADPAMRERVTAAIRENLREAGRLEGRVETISVLIPRTEMTGAERAKAERYAVGDVVEYRETSGNFGKGERARVAVVEKHRLTVETGEGKQVTYDPRFLRGVTVYKEEERAFAVGDRVMFTADDPARGLVRSRMGEIRELTPERVTVGVTDRGREREVAFERKDFRAVDHGYAVDRLDDMASRFGRVIVESSTGRHEKPAVAALREATADVRIVTDDVEGFATAAAKLFPESRRRNTEKPKVALVVAENPDRERVVAELRAARVARGYESIHRTMTGEAYRDERMAGARLTELAGKGVDPKYTAETERLAKARGIAVHPAADALAALGERVRVVSQSNPVDLARFTRDVMILDGVAEPEAERKAIGGLLEMARSLPAARQTELALNVLDRMLKRDGKPPMSVRERESFAETLNDGAETRRAPALFSQVTQAESFRASFGTRPRNDREAVLAVGLLTGDLDGFPKQPNLDIGRAMATRANEYFTSVAEMGVMNLADRIDQENGLHASNGKSMLNGRRLFLTVETGLTEGNWKTLAEDMGRNASIRVVFQDVLTQADRDLLKDAARRDPTLLLGTATSLGRSVRLELETGEAQTRTTTIEERSRPDRGMGLGF